jgi:hypothetical protein
VTPRVRRTFWALIVIAVIATGALTMASNARPRSTAGLTVAAASVTLVASVFLALRILLVVGRPGPAPATAPPEIAARLDGFEP